MSGPAGPRTKDKDLDLGYTLNLVCHHSPLTSPPTKLFLDHKSLQTITVWILTMSHWSWQSGQHSGWHSGWHFRHGTPVHCNVLMKKNCRLGFSPNMSHITPAEWPHMPKNFRNKQILMLQVGRESTVFMLFLGMKDIKIESSWVF